MLNFVIKVDNVDETIAEMKRKAEKAMEECGLTAEAYTVKNINDKHIVDTGALKGSITHDVSKDGETYTTTVGSNLEYAIYNELGTGRYYPGGQSVPWVYMDAKGNFHRTDGMQARPFLKPAIADHVQTYKDIIKETMEN